MLTIEDIKDYLDYNPDTGVFTWKKRRRGVKAGSVAGTKISAGYIHIRVNKTREYAHRLAFLFMGQPLPKYVDHINGVRDDNRWCNLRPCNQSQNMCNSVKRADNKSGVKGVWWDKRREKWETYIKKEHKKVFLGYFDCISYAACIRAIAEDKYHGEFKYRQSDLVEEV